MMHLSPFSENALVSTKPMAHLPTLILYEIFALKGCLITI